VTSNPQRPLATAESQRGLLRLGLLSLGTGAGTGLVVGCFRRALDREDSFRNALIPWAHNKPLPGFFLVVGAVAGATALAVWLVRRFAQHAAGSGIPHVEAVINGELPPAPFALLPVKFLGGQLAMGAGLALGREGPSVQMGASIGTLWEKSFQLDDPDRVALLAAGAGAGLATAFNAPLAGAAFVLEELVRRFDTRIALAALGASGAAIGVARLLVGQDPDFSVETLPYPATGSGIAFVALGVIAGLAGVAYNHTALGACAVADRFDRWRPEFRAAIIGALVGVVAWFAPGMAGGGRGLTQESLSGHAVLALFPLMFALRFLLGSLSYAAGTPGGLFAPMLVLGSQLGLGFALVCQLGFGSLGAPPVAFALAGMAAFFTAVVRAPLTGIVLIVELTASFNQLLPMLWACFAAMAVPTLLGNASIYDSLKARTVRREAIQTS
jgi:CIC family chloride channel protein